MVRGYILVQTTLGTAREVSAAIGLVPGVVCCHDVTGPYDVIVQVEAADMDELGRLVATHVQSVPGITRTVTCPVVNLG